VTTDNTHNRQTSIPPVGFEPTISAGKRPKTYPLDPAATGTGTIIMFWIFSTASGYFTTPTKLAVSWLYFVFRDLLLVY
jgi:hypothetical protein